MRGLKLCNIAKLRARVETHIYLSAVLKVYVLNEMFCQVPIKLFGFCSGVGFGILILCPQLITM